MKLDTSVELYAGGQGSGCRGPNCGRPSGSTIQHSGKQDYRTIKILLKGKEVGYLSYEHNKNNLRVKDVFVAKNFRGKGFGSALYRELVKLARREGKREIWSDNIVSSQASRIWKSIGGVKQPGNASGYKLEVDAGKLKAATGKYYVVSKNYGNSPGARFPTHHDGRVVSEHDTPEEAEKASLAMPYTRVMSEPRREEKPEVRDAVRRRVVRTNPDTD